MLCGKYPYNELEHSKSFYLKTMAESEIADLREQIITFAPNFEIKEF